MVFDRETTSKDFFVCELKYYIAVEALQRISRNLISRQRKSDFVNYYGTQYFCERDNSRKDLAPTSCNNICNNEIEESIFEFYRFCEAFYTRIDEEMKMRTK